MWVLFSVLASIVNAIYYIANQNVKLSASVFMVYRGIIVALMALPFLFCFKVIPAWQFYAIAILQGCITAYSDKLSFLANQKYGAETVSSILPLSVSFTFFLWLFIEPIIIFKYLQTPVRTSLIILALGGTIFALMKYRRVKVAKEVFIFLLPVIVLGAVISTCNKTIMEYAADSLLGLCVWRVFVSSTTVGIIHLVIYFNQHGTMSELLNKTNLLKNWIFIFMPLSMICRNMAMYYSVNPSYVSALVQTSLLWVMFFNKWFSFIPFKRVSLKFEKKWALLLLFSVLLLILASG